MKTPRFFCRPIIRPVTRLSDEESRHAAGVMRLGPGAGVELFDGAGTAAEGRILTIGKKEVSVEIIACQSHTPPETGRIAIAAAVAKGERFDGLVTQCTELGVDHIVPVIFERTVKLASGQQLRRYERLAISACKQSGRLFMPIIEGPVELNTAVKNLRERYPQATMIFGSFGGPWWDQAKIDPGGDTIAFVGPEGGMTEAEESLLAGHGAKPVRLTETVLRVETAALAMAALLAAQRHGRNQN